LIATFLVGRFVTFVGFAALVALAIGLFGGAFRALATTRFVTLGCGLLRAFFFFACATGLGDFDGFRALVRDRLGELTPELYSSRAEERTTTKGPTARRSRPQAPTQASQVGVT